MFKKIENNPSYVRSGQAVISIDIEAKEAYKKQKNLYKKINSLESRIENLEKIITELQNKNTSKIQNS